MILSRQLASVCGRVVGFELRACVQTTDHHCSAAGSESSRRTAPRAQPAGQQLPASQPVSVFCNFLFLLLPHFLCIYVCVCPALDPEFTAISRASGLVPLLEISSVNFKLIIVPAQPAHHGGYGISTLHTSSSHLQQPQTYPQTCPILSSN